jgi:pSer/pThr/pTyr-binding forkhead associated (FHA) protein
MHCPECGFVNAEGSNYCQKCGAFLADVGQQEEGDNTTVAWQIGETGDLKAVDPEQIAQDGATLVIRSGGGRSGETFVVGGEQARIGRSPEAEVFLDDVTVSRNHALLVRRRDGIYIDDLGSLNGTYVNRKRIESHKLQDGDELQVGKYKLTFLG